MTTEQIAENEAAKGENTQKETKPKGAAKTKKDQPDETDLAAAAGKTAEYFEEQGAKSKENKSAGGSEVVVSLTNKTMVRFTKNHGYFKKGHEQEVSDVAYAIYDKARVIEKL
jgi:hypothetical protein